MSKRSTIPFSMIGGLLFSIMGLQGLAAQSGCDDPPRLPATESAEEDGLARRENPINAKDPCETADSNLSRSMKAILAGNPGAPVAARRWNRISPPKGLSKIARRFALSPSEKAILAKNGFVVLDRMDLNYAFAFHEIYQSELPLFVSADSILNAIYVSNDGIIKHVEVHTVTPILYRMLAVLHCTLAKSHYSKSILHDLDLYLTVARRLLEDREVKSISGVDEEAVGLVALAKKASGMEEVELFGRHRVIDFSQFQPRGHYTDMAPFFRAVMWLSRLEFNLSSRSCRSSQPGDVPDPRETPAEAKDAMALALLVKEAGEDEDLQRLDRIWSLLAGRREDIAPTQLRELMIRAGINTGNDIDTKAGTNAERDIPLDSDEAPRRLIQAIGHQFRRTVNTHYQPEGTTELPAILTLLGPRIVADSQSLMPVVNPGIPGRYQAHALDAAYVLGNDRALSYLAADRKKFPSLERQLGLARRNFSANGTDLYSLWLSAIGGLNAPIGKAPPAFMRSAAYQDLRLNSIIGGFAQIRHNYVLLAAQTYDFGGCRIPFGYVEPAVEVYRRLIRYAETGEAAMKELGGDQPAIQYFARTRMVLGVLLKIAQTEAEGRPLTEEMNRFLSMVSEMSPGGTGGPPTYTGWYFDLFYNRGDALKDSSLIADFYTSAHEQKVSYAGISGTRLGVFIVDTGGGPRAVIGPVTKSFEALGDTKRRYTDGDVSSVAKSMPWASTYMAPAPPGPALSLEGQFASGNDCDVLMAAPKKLRAITIELLDHHRRRLSIRTIQNPHKVPHVRLHWPAGTTPEVIHVQAGDYHGWAEISWQGIAFRSGQEP